MKIFSLELCENYHHEQLRYTKSGEHIELDIYLPNERLAFEYQGEYHFHDIFNLGDLWLRQQRDREKRTTCEEHGITLVEVPYWWDLNPSSLMGNIHQQRPNIFPNRSINGDSIPMKPLQEFSSGLFDSH